MPSPSKVLPAQQLRNHREYMLHSVLPKSPKPALDESVSL